MRPSLRPRGASGGRPTAARYPPIGPTTPWGVGWYQFTAYPGAGGNAVLAVHVDWFTGAPAVFAGLGGLRSGDLVYAARADGTPLVYTVASSEWVRPQSANLAAIRGGSGRDMLSLITCGGAWDVAAQDHSHRLIVRAVRLR